jgi:hypothetical protein
MKEYSDIQRRVFKVVVRLLEDRIDDLERRHTDNPWKEEGDLGYLIRELERLAGKASKFYEGGYTVFVYNVLVGMLNGLYQVMDKLEAWIDNLESDLIAWKYFEEEEGIGREEEE